MKCIDFRPFDHLSEGPIVTPSSQKPSHKYSFLAGIKRPVPKMVIGTIGTFARFAMDTGPRLNFLGVWLLFHVWKKNVRKKLYRSSAVYSKTTWKVDGAGLSWLLTKPTFGSCAIHFQHSVSKKAVTFFPTVDWGPNFLLRTCATKMMIPPPASFRMLGEVSCSEQLFSLEVI